MKPRSTLLKYVTDACHETGMVYASTRSAAAIRERQSQLF
jgi:hypothetical protein